MGSKKNRLFKGLLWSPGGKIEKCAPWQPFFSFFDVLLVSLVVFFLLSSNLPFSHAALTSRSTRNACNWMLKHHLLVKEADYWNISETYFLLSYKCVKGYLISMYWFAAMEYQICRFLYNFDALRTCFTIQHANTMPSQNLQPKTCWLAIVLCLYSTSHFFCAHYFFHILLSGRPTQWSAVTSVFGSPK